MSERTSKARKDHRCSFCCEMITKGTRYICQRVTPWDHADNECFFTIKAHVECDSIWQQVGSEFDWQLPDGKIDWEEMLAQLKWLKSEAASKKTTLKQLVNNRNMGYGY